MVFGWWFACADPSALAVLAGAWDGETDAGWAMSAEFAYDEPSGLLTGQVTIEEADETHAYAVRRSRGGASLHVDLTEVVDPTRGLELDGALLGAQFVGDAEVRTPCAEGTCGWVGAFTLDQRANDARR